MVEFRNRCYNATLGNFWSNGYAVGVARLGCGYLFMARTPNYNKTVDTGLPEGDYCNIIDGCETKVEVDANGMANITVDTPEQIIALCINCLGEDPTSVPTTTSTTATTTTTTTTTTSSTTSTTSTTTTTTTTTTTITTSTTTTTTTTTTITTSTTTTTTKTTTQTTTPVTTPTTTGFTECCQSINFESTGIILDLHQNTTGTYKMISEDNSGRKVYRNAETGYSIFYFTNTLMHFSAWVLEISPGDFNIASEEDPICVTDTSVWEVFQDESWKVDETVSIDCSQETTVATETTSTVSTRDPDICCSKVLFYSSGLINENYPHALGVYTKISYDTELSKHVYKHDETSLYLIYYEYPLMHFHSWVISTSTAVNDFFIANEDSGNCVERLQQPWNVLTDAGEMVEDSSAGVMCEMEIFTTTTTVPTDVSTVPTDVSTVPTDVSTVPTDVSTVPTDVSTSSSDSTSEPPEPTIYPPISCCNLVQFFSSGPIQQNNPEALGVYKKLYFDSLGRTVYKRRDAESYLYYIEQVQFHLKAWVISDSVTEDGQSISNFDSSSCVEGLTESWTVLINEADWVEDTTANVTCVEAHCCQELNVTSDGQIQDLYPGALTMYYSSQTDEDEMPVYVSANGVYSIYYVNDVNHHTSGWTISSQCDGVGEILNEGLMSCPEEGLGSWEYQNGEGWSVDNTLSFNCEQTQCCHQLMIESDGEAAQYNPQVLGSYFYVEENDERPLYKHTQHSHIILSFDLEYSQWVVSSSGDWILANNDESNCASDIKLIWDVFDGENWQPDESLTITCK